MKSKTTQRISLEDQVAQLKSMGIPEDEAIKIAKSTEKNFWNNISRLWPTAIIIVAAIIVAGLIFYILDLVKNNSVQLLEFENRIATIEYQLTSISPELGTSTTPTTEIAVVNGDKQTPPSPTISPSRTQKPTQTQTFTPTLTLSPTPEVIGKIIAPRLIIRSGPGKEFEQIGALAYGSLVLVVAKDQSSSWFQIWHRDSGILGWTSSEYVMLQGGASAPIQLTPMQNITPTIVPTNTPEK